MNKYKNKVAIVTGGGMGLGRAFNAAIVIGGDTRDLTIEQYASSRNRGTRLIRRRNGESLASPLPCDLKAKTRA
jgi:NAD(P)-dependent dehydrogenase (short-subunit alcohol dehydrogenase family)